jgi:hypothetical protein
MKKCIIVRRMKFSKSEKKMKYLHSKMKSMFLKCISDKTAKITLVEMKTPNLYSYIFSVLYFKCHILSQFK